jgi:hypothetical protein
MVDRYISDQPSPEINLLRKSCGQKREQQDNMYNSALDILGKDSADKSIAPEYLPGVITFLDNVCLAMKTDYKETLKRVTKDASYHGVGMSEGSDKKYEEISDKYREVFGNAENWFAGKKENVSLLDALNAWEFIHEIY